MTRSKDAFGDPGLISSDIAPTYEKQRTLNAAREWSLWMALVLGAVSASTGNYLGEAVWGVAARSVAVVLLTLAAALLLTSTASRFGVGSGPLSRSTFGARAAIPIHLLRYGVGVAWTAAHLRPFGEWMGLLVQATGIWAAPHAGFEWTATAEVTHWGTLVVLSLLLGWVARGRIRRSRLTARFLLMLGGSAFVLLFGAVLLSRSWILAASRPFALHSFLDQVSLSFVDAMFLLWAVPEWVRYRERNTDSKQPWRMAPFVAVVFACLVVGLSAVSQATRGHTDGYLIADAAGSFGLALGWLGAFTALTMTFSVLPLFGVLTASLALCSVVPRWRYPYVAYATSLLVAVVAGFAQPPPWLVALTLPPLAAVITDEWLIRRRTVVLDALYTAGGTRLPALIATLLGCAFIVYEHDYLAASSASAMLIAMIGTALPLIARLPKRAPKKDAAPRGQGPDNWADRPMVDNPWNPEDTTRVEKPPTE